MIKRNRKVVAPRKKIDKKYVLFILLFYLFVFFTVLDDYISFLGFFDEIVAICAVPFLFIYVLKKRKIKWNSNTFLFFSVVLYFLLGVSGNVFSKLQPVNVVLGDAFTNMKFWMAIFSGWLLGSVIDIKKYASNILLHIKIVICIFLSLSLLYYLGYLFGAVYDGKYKVNYLFYQHPTYFSASCAFIFVVMIGIKEYAFDKKLFIAILLLLCTTFKAKAIGSAFCFVIISYLIFIRKKRISIKTVIAVIPLMLFVAWNKITKYYIGDDAGNAARSLLMIKSMDIANKYFPFGAGFGTYASHLSATNYSPLYEQYGLSKIYGLKQDNPMFMSDTYWPMVIGQMGWLGLILFVFIVFFMYINVSKLRKKSIAFYASGCCMIAFILIASTAESSFVHPIMLPLAFWLGVMNGNKIENRNGKDNYI